MPTYTAPSLANSLERLPRSTVVVGAVSAQALVAVLDWATRPQLSLSSLYFLPFILLCIGGVSALQVAVLSAIITTIKIAIWLRDQHAEAWSWYTLSVAVTTFCAFFGIGLLAGMISSYGAKARALTNLLAESQAKVLRFEASEAQSDPPELDVRSALVVMRNRNLSYKELQVLRHIGADRQTKAIADCLGISESAVKATVQRLYDKLDVPARTRAALVKVVMDKHSHLFE